MVQSGQYFYSSWALATFPSYFNTWPHVLMQNPILFVPEPITLSQQCWLFQQAVNNPCEAMLIISLNIQDMEGVGDTVSQSVRLEYKVEVGQLGTPFHFHNCMVVEPLKWEKKEDRVKNLFSRCRLQVFSCWHPDLHAIDIKPPGNAFSFFSGCHYTANLYQCESLFIALSFTP